MINLSMSIMDAIFSLVIPILAAAFSGWTLYLTHLKKGKIEALFDKICVYIRARFNDASNMTRMFIPTFVLYNSGVLPVALENIRILLNGNIQKYIYPTMEVPKESIYNAHFKEYNLLFAGGYEFRPFFLDGKQFWENYFAFSIDDDDANCLIGKISFRLEVLYDNKWHHVSSKEFDFSIDPDLGVSEDPSQPIVKHYVKRTVDWKNK